MRILYLEDNLNDAKLVKRYIDTTGHTLILATTLSAAREAVEQQMFDLILVDVMLGTKRGGAEFVQELRSRKYASPVVGVTALTSAQDMALYRQVGFDTILAKPFTILEIAQILEQYLVK
jgi:DNA-binding response OmpR family regulator